jgi:hypothetical protein
MGGNLGNVVGLNINQQQQQQHQQHQQQLQQQQMNVANLQMVQTNMSQFDSLAATLNLTGSLNLPQMSNMNASQQIKLDPNIQYGQGTSGIYI